MTDYSEDDTPRLNLMPDAADALTAGERLVISLNLGQTSHAALLGILTTSKTALPNTKPVRYFNPAAKFDYLYNEFTGVFNEAVAQWDGMDTDEHHKILDNMDGIFYMRLNKAYEYTKNMLQILENRTYCDQRSTENYRQKLKNFLKPLAVVLGKEAETERVQRL